MKLYPVHFLLEGKPALVVGGGTVAAAKARALLQSGARVRVIAPLFAREMTELIESAGLQREQREFMRADLDNVRVVVAATNRLELQRAIFEEAETRGILCCAVDDPAHSNFIVPAVLRRGDLVVTVSTSGVAPALAVRLRDLIGEILGEEYAAVLDRLRLVRQELKSRYPDFARRREAWYRLLDTEILPMLRRGDRPRPKTGEDGRARPSAPGGPHQIALTDSSKPEAYLLGARCRTPEAVPSYVPDAERSADESQSSPGALAGRREATNGKVFIVGAGPGDPRLITVRGLQCIQAADVLIYDRLVDPSLVEEAPPHAERIYAGKESSHHTLPQEQINALMETHARMGRTVVRLKGGDPFVLGRGGDEAAFLAARGLVYEIVPGVSSATAVPAFAGIPVTQRGVSSSFAVATGHGCGGEELPDFAAMLRHVGTLVILMGVGNLHRITAQLLAGGTHPTMPVAVIEHGTQASQRTIVSTLGELSARIPELQSPAVIVVGQVALLHETLRWFQELQPVSAGEQ